MVVRVCMAKARVVTRDGQLEDSASEERMIKTMIMVENQERRRILRPSASPRGVFIGKP